MALLTLSLQILNPILNNSAFAAEETKTSRASAATPTASLAIGGMDLAQTITTAPGNTAYREHTVEVSSENIANYMLTITGPVGLNGGSTMTGAGGKTPANMAYNSWGYAYGQSGSKETMTYSSFTSNAQTLESAEGAPNFTKNLVFAAKFAQYATPAHYRGNVEVALTATPGEVIAGLGFGGITEMQSMSSAVCNQVSVGTEGRLIDVRDGKAYWVAKLADGKCWMTQNLAIGTEGITLDSETSDLPSGKTYAIATPTQANKSGFSFGEYVYTTPTVQDSCNLRADSGEAVPSLTVADCAEHGWQNVSALEASGDPAFYKNNGNKVVANGKYDAHYLLGAYYTWSGAIAGTGVSSSDDGFGDITVGGSVCPKNWTLAKGGPEPDNDFHTLLTAYGLGTELANASYDVRLAPLYFLYSGYVYPNGFITLNSLNVYLGNMAYYMMGYGVEGNGILGRPFYVSNVTNSFSTTYLNSAQLAQVRCIAK